MNRERPDAEEALTLDPTRTEAGKVPPREAEGLWSDREIASQKEDRFSSQDYADVLAVRAVQADTPLTIGIYGRWGSGKTSLMRLIEAVLPQETEGGGRLRCIWINAWELSNQEEVWHAFLQALFNQVHRQLPLWQRIDKGKLLKQLATNSYRIVLVVTPMILGVLISRPETGWEDVLQTLTTPIAGAGTLLTVGLGLWALVKPIIEAARETVNFDLEAVLKYQPYEVQITELMRLREQFEAMVETWVGDRGRLVVFIDDLDRCTPDKVPEVLEAIKLFTTTRRCVYVLGLDHDIVRQGIKAKYKFETPTEATEYLEKIVQIPFHLPPLDQGRVETFVRDYYPDLRQVCPTAPDVFARGLEPNPRKVKRALNVYRTLLDLAEVRVDAWEMDPVEPELVAKMVVIENRFRALHQYLVKAPGFLLKLEEEALGDDGLGGPPLAEDEEVSPALIEKPATGASEAEPGLIEPAGLEPLKAMLCAGDKRFKDKDQRDQVSSYIYLSATTVGGVEQIRPNRRERAALLGGDREQIKAQVEEILRKGADEGAQERITKKYLDRLQGVLDHPDRYTTDEWKSADIALSLLGVLSSGETLEGVLDRLDGSGDYGTTQILWANKALDAYGEQRWERQEFEPETLRVPTGEFLMGSDPGKDKDAEDDEQPQHTLELPAYRIARYPVTNAQYLAFVQAASHSVPHHWEDGKPPGGKEEHPVVNVTWLDALAYCKWLAEITGQAYRLPSEAEWEKAARGRDGRIYPWGNEWDAKLCNSAEGGLGDTTPVGQYSPGGDSPYACADMAGNVWEWTRSEFRDYPYDPEGGREDPEAGGPFALRGGSWYNNQRNARVSYRNNNHPDTSTTTSGFALLWPLS